MIASWGVRHTGSVRVLVPCAFSLFNATIILKVRFTAHKPVRTGKVPCCVYVELKEMSKLYVGWEKNDDANEL